MAQNKKAAGYTDVRADEWFTESIQTIKRKGVDGVALLEGDPDGSFGVGDPVKREALAVVADRLDRLQENEKLLCENNMLRKINNKMESLRQID